MVCDNIYFPEDYHALCKASSQYEKWLYLSKPRIFIGTVVQHFLRLMSEKLSASKENYVAVPYFWRIERILLRIRAISPSWRTIVDEQLGHFLETQINLKPIMRFFPKYTFKISNDLTRFKNHFASHSENPLLFRVAFIKYEGDTGVSLQVFWKELLEFCGIYGHHIWYLYLFINPFMVHNCLLSLSDHYYNVTLLLQHLPNLKNFQLLRPIYFPIRGAGPLPASDREAEQIKHILDNNPVPVLKNLKSFIGPTSANCFVKHFLTRNPHVEVLNVAYDDKGKIEDVYTGPLTNIMDLHLSFRLNRQFLALTKCNYVWKNTKLTLNLQNLSVDWDTLLDFLNTTFPYDQLKELIVYMPERRFGSKPATKFLEFLYLTHVQVYMDNYFPLDFLLKARHSIVKFKICVASTPENNSCYENAINSEDFIKLFGHLKNLRKSNIWTKFRKLKSLCYQEEIFDMRINEVLIDREDLALDNQNET